MIKHFSELFKPPIVHIRERKLDIAQRWDFKFERVGRIMRDAESTQIIQRRIYGQSIFFKILIGKKRFSMARCTMCSEKLQTIFYLVL
jgi:hypothetical protein